MKKAHFIPVFVTVSFAAGILLFFFINPEKNWIYYGSLFSFLLFLFAHIREKRLIAGDAFFGITAGLVLLSLGMLIAFQKQAQNQRTHYLHQNLENPVLLKVRINQRLRPNAFQFNYIADVKEMDNQMVTGKILLAVQRDSLATNFEVSDYLFVKTELRDIYKPLNPYQFDYGAYMENKQVFKRATVSSNQILVLESNNFSLTGRAAKIRKNIKENLQRNNFSREQIALMEALLLGQRTELSRETYQSFSEAGVVHVLAVSGLHVGIMMSLLLFFFRVFVPLPGGKYIRLFLVLIFLWAYAVIAGLSPSILRAVTMFSFFSIAVVFKRQGFTLNMLLLSALVLLIYNPNFILDVGFQLSYSAVLAILLFQKKIFMIFPYRNFVWKFFWGLSSVTLSAQLGVLPLSLFYFHQFPGLFFVSNLAVIPLVTFILWAGAILMLFTNWFNLPDIFVKSYGVILDLLQYMVARVAEKSSFVLKHIYFSPVMLIISLIMIGLIAFVVHKKSKTSVFLLLGIIILFQVNFLFENHRLSKDKDFYIFHKSRFSVLGKHQNNMLELNISPYNFNEKSNLLFLDGFRNAKGINKIKTDSLLKNYWVLKKERLFVIDETALYQLPDISIKPVVLLKNSPKINLDRMLDSVQPKMVIADGSNYTNAVRMWESTCLKKEIPFHYTGEKGAYNFEL